MTPVTNDGPGAIDPLVAAGPRSPLNSVRPGVSPQRLLVLDAGSPQMVDIASGQVGPWENGPPVALPAVSSAFDLVLFDWIQVQVPRDMREASRETTLVSVNLEEADRVVDVRESADGLLVIDDGESQASGPIGESPQIVVMITVTTGDEGELFEISARNAETLTAVSLPVRTKTTTYARLTIGGPTTMRTGDRGRKRAAPVHVDVQVRQAPVDQVRRAVRHARKVAGSLRDRIGE